MNCPKCNSEMEMLVCNRLEVDRCKQCGGIWLDAGEKDDLLRQFDLENLDVGDPNDGRLHSKKSPVFCPRCETQMFHVSDLHQPHITIERCVTCSGCFLDAGELKDLKDKSILDFLKQFLPGGEWKRLKNDSSFIRFRDRTD